VSLLIMRDASRVTVSAQASTDDYADCGAALDATHTASVSYTILNKHATRVLHWKVLADNDAAFTAPVTIQAEADIAGAASATYAVAQAPYRYYKVQIQSQDAGLACTADLFGIAKG